MTRAFLGLGSNMGDRMAYLEDAVAAMDGCVAVSGVYETDPVGGPDQGQYLNVVVELDTSRSARGLLELCQALEASAAECGKCAGAPVRWMSMSCGWTARRWTSPTWWYPIPGCSSGHS